MAVPLLSDLTSILDYSRGNPLQKFIFYCSGIAEKDTKNQESHWRAPRHALNMVMQMWN